MEHYRAQKPHPYIPNSNPAVQQRMLEAIGADSIESLYEEIPEPDGPAA